MSILIIILGLTFAYLIGSLPTAIWYGKAFFGLDVRDYGSGNAGATNTFRVMGKRAGTIVMLVDILKGWTATNAAFFLAYYNVIEHQDLVLYKLFFGLAAVAGHIFPIYEKFKGGKGVATLLGMVLSIQSEAALLCIAVFLIVFLTSKYVSLGSMISALAFPVLLCLPRFNPHQPVVVLFAFAIFALVVITHQKNIVRLFHGEENKAKIRLRRR